MNSGDSIKIYEFAFRLAGDCRKYNAGQRRSDVYHLSSEFVVVKIMNIYEPLPTLLNIELHEDSVILRLDENGLGYFDTGKNSIREITLSGCILENSFINELQELINEVFEYEIFQQDNKTIFQFWADYGRVEDEIECTGSAETFSDYTKEDLAQKGSALHNLYVDLHKRFSDSSAINDQLRNKLKFEIENEIERSKRKSQFFEEKNTGKSEAFQSESRFLQKLQNLLSGDFED